MDVCPSKRIGYKLKWCGTGQTHIILCSISMAAWEPKSLHKLHCYLGQTSVSKHMGDLDPQLPTLSSVLVLYTVCVHITTHACTNKCKHLVLSHWEVTEYDTVREGLKWFSFFFLNQPQVEFESAHSLLVTHLVWSNISYVCASCMWLGIVCACVGVPPKFLLVFHDILQAMALWFYTKKTHQLLFFLLNL